jgi:4-amino-4-deoxy-L-arabinose transferase-like glycosyltransferase
VLYRLLLGALLACSLVARAAWLGDPCRAPCRTAADRTLVFDEVYYVNAARRIAGVSVATAGHYASTPAGEDPNAEHPQLVKLLIAGAIEVFGDGPFAWRIGSLVFGTLALLGMYVLVRAAGGDERLALIAAALMAADNLLLVHGRIGTLDVYAVAAMVWGVAAYIRGRTVTAGLVLGIGAGFKLVTPYALPALVLVELGRALRRTGTDRLRLPEVIRTSSAAAARLGLAARLGVTTATGAATFIALLALLDRIAPPFDTARHRIIGGGPLAHLSHILTFAGHQVDRHGPHGIASYPWQWWGDYKPIVYLNIDPSHPSRGLSHIQPAVHFLGVVSPPILVLALPAIWVAGRRLLQRRPGAASAGAASGVDLLGLAWCLGTFLPFELASALLGRTSYLYYMAIVMPGVYVLVARLVTTIHPPRWALRLWIGSVVVAALAMYPLTPLP